MKSSRLNGFSSPKSKKVLLMILSLYLLVSASFIIISIPESYAQPASLEFGRTINLSNTHTRTTWADMAESGNNVYVVWRDLWARDDVIYTRSANEALSFQRPLPFRLYVHDFGITSPPKIAASGDNVYAVWADPNLGNNNEIFLAISNDGGYGFNFPINISETPNGDSVDPQIFASGNNVYIIWKDNADGGSTKIFFRSSNDGGRTFEPVSRTFPWALIGDPNSLRVATSGDNLYLVMTHGTNIHFARSTDGGATFESYPGSGRPLNEGSSRLALSPYISIDGNNVYVAWVDPATYDIYLRRSTDGGATFQVAQRLSTTIGVSVDPKVAALGNNVYVVWNEGGTSTEFPDAFLARSTDGGATFETPKGIGGRIGGFNPQLSIYQSNVYAVMSAVEHGSLDVAITRSTNNGSTFEDPINLSNNTGLSTNQKMIVDEQGNVYVLWEDKSLASADNPENTDILFRSTNTDEWSGQLNIGGFIAKDPAVADNADGRLQVFARGENNSLMTTDQVSPNNNNWTPWAGFPGEEYLIGDPVVAKNADGRLQVFARGFQNWDENRTAFHGLITTTQTQPNINSWNNWTPLGGYFIGDPVVAKNADGRLQVFARGSGNNLMTAAQTSPNNNNWTPWVSLGGYLIGDPVVAKNADGRLQVFARGSDNNLVTNVQTTPGSDIWTSWGSLGGYLTSDPAAGNNSDGRILVTAVGRDNDIQYIVQSAPDSGMWSRWLSLEGYISGKPTIAQNADGRLEIFGIGPYFDIWHIWQTQILPNGEIKWSEWRSLGQFYTSNIAAARNADGTLEIFAKDGRNSLNLKYQLAPNIDQ